jgi:hypothetical protein
LITYFDTFPFKQEILYLIYISLYILKSSLPVFCHFLFVLYQRVIDLSYNYLKRGKPIYAMSHGTMQVVGEPINFIKKCKCSCKCLHCELLVKNSLGTSHQVPQLHHTGLVSEWHQFKVFSSLVCYYNFHIWSFCLIMLYYHNFKCPIHLEAVKFDVAPMRIQYRVTEA